MALLDPIRARALFDEEELALAVALIAGPGEPGESRPEALQRLDEAGAIENGELVGWLAVLLEPISAPTLHAVGEIVIEQRMVIVAQAWRSEHGCVLGRLGLDGLIELREIDEGMIPAALGVEVGLARRPVREDRERLVIRIDELSSSPDEHLGAIYSSRVASWRITAARATEGDSVAVLDGGDEGLWVTEEAEAGGEPAIAFVPVSGDEIAARLTGLFAQA